MTENWKAVPGFPGYDVSDHGRVRSYFAQGGNGIEWHISKTPQRILQPSNKNSKGYSGVNFNSTSNHKTIHRIVMLAFIGPCPEGLEVCHNDDDPTNNHLGNLRYDTHQANLRDASLNGRYILKPEDVLAVRKRRANGEKLSAIARDYPIGATTVRDVCIGKSYVAVGGPLTRRNWYKLSPDDVSDIRRRITNDTSTTQADLARQYSVSESMISRIVNNTRRASNTEPA